MNDEIFELVDRDYEKCQREEYPRQIKTRHTSFSSILEKFTNFRINHLKNKLEKMKDKALTDNYTQKNYDDKLEKKSLIIAKLEEKIKLLSRENVPATYVDNRAIKLKKKMSDNLVYNVGKFYSIGLEKKEDVFAVEDNKQTEELNEAVMSSAASVEKDAQELNVDTIDRQTIIDSVNEEFSKTEAKETPLTKEDIRDTINNEFDNIDSKESIDRATIIQSIDDEFDKKEKEEIEEYASVNNTISSEDIKDVVNEELNRIERIPEIEDNSQVEAKEEFKLDEEHPEEDVMFKISKNNGASAKISRYDSEGNDVRKYDYVPMTDDEIRESQIKLGFDELGNLINKTKSYEYVPMTDDEIRESQEKIEFNKYDKHIDQPQTIEKEYIDEAEFYKEDEELPKYIIHVDNEVKDDQYNNVSINKYDELKEKIMHLKEQQEITKREKELARKNAEEAAEKAREMREMLAESEKSVAESIDMLKAYSEALEEDCDRNRKSAEESNSSAQADREFISSNKGKIEDNNRLIDEIGAIIGERPEKNVNRVR